MGLKSAKNDNWSSPETNKYNVSGKNQDFYTSERAPGVQINTSGGTKVESPTDIFHVFTGSEPFDNDGIAITVDILLIGGGGGTTTSAWSGGGGAGGYRLLTNAPVATGTSNPIVIGAGTGQPQTVAGSTSALGYSVGGGGRGGPAHVSGSAAPQGSGGGGGGPDNGYPPWGGSAGPGNTSYGNWGGPASANSQGPAPGGGGGGIGGAGRPTSYPSPSYAPWHWAQYPSNGGGVGGPGAHPAEPTFPMSVIAPAFPSPTATFLLNPNTYDSFCRGGCGRPRSGYGVAQGFANTGGGSGGNDAGFGGSGCVIVRIPKAQ